MLESLNTPGPERVQVTPAFVESLLTVAVMLWVAPWLMVGVVVGVSETVTPDFPEQPAKTRVDRTANASKKTLNLATVFL